MNLEARTPLEHARARSRIQAKVLEQGEALQQET